MYICPYSFVQLSNAHYIQNMPLSAAIIGPGRSKQGTGPYIARTFQELGVKISGVVSSSLASALSSTKQLKNDYAIDCPPYASLDELLKNQATDIVAICSPSGSHHPYLYTAITAGCHIFCEKPFWWPTEAVKTPTDVQNIIAETTKLVALSKAQNVVLQLNTQWPFTLPTYYEIFPQQDQILRPIETFEMWLSPQSSDKTMIIDAAPHLLSMLYALVGSGRIQNIKSNFQAAQLNKEIKFEFDYLHAFGDTKVALILCSSKTGPKPAAYAINHRRVDRHIELTNYLLSLHSVDKQLPVADPLVCSIKNFLSSIHAKASPDEVALIDGMSHLAQIYQAVN